MELATSLVASPDGEWVAIRRDRELSIYAGAGGPPVGKLLLDSDDADVTLVGPPNMLVVVLRDATPRVMLYRPPYLDAVARLDLESPLRIGAITGARLVLIAAGVKQAMIVRAAGRALASQLLELESPIEFVVGLERNQLLFSVHKKLEVWDAVAGRPVARMQLQLPPVPRLVGAAQGHLWVMQPASDELFVYRLSDGRPFRHHAGAPILQVIHHPLSPLLVLVTSQGLLRLHCFAHSLTVIDAPWTGEALGQLVIGDDIALLGLPAGDDEPWRVPIAGAGAPTIAAAVEPAELPPPSGTGVDRLRERAASEPVQLAEPPKGTAADRLRAIRDRGSREPGEGTLAQTAIRTTSAGRTRQWREPIAELGLELARSGTGELPIVAVDTELGALAHRLGLSTPARRATIALYALHLVGQASMAIAALSHALGDWTEPLGQGELAALAMLKQRDGRVALRRGVTDLLDGTRARSIRLCGEAAATPRSGAFRLAREGKTDAELEDQLATELGRIAIVDGDPDHAILEARMHGATAVAFHAPAHLPRPWPRDAALVLVLYGSPTSWIADLPALGS
ncbi:MAG: hypothetical protein M3680_12800 [Myxococcota bacterium]|nr:hypothetical protein [Myxococcota bacterium]